MTIFPAIADWHTDTSAVRFWHKAVLDEDTSPLLFTRYGSLSNNLYSINCLCTSLLIVGLRRDFTLAGPLRPQGSFAS